MGMTRGETWLTLIVFALVYGGALLPRLGERLGVLWASRRASPPEGDGDARG